MRNRSGDLSFEDFVRARSGSLLRTALLLAGQNRAEAEDLLQIALERAYRHWPRVVRTDEPERMYGGSLPMRRQTGGGESAAGRSMQCLPTKRPAYPTERLS